MKKRIWELDALRGFCSVGVIIVHFVYDLTVLYRLVDWTPPEAFRFVQRWGGVLFLLISGICVTLGSRCIKRGLIVFFCGLGISAVTYGMYHFGFSGRVSSSISACSTVSVCVCCCGPFSAKPTGSAF